jgi:hypothetical protein
MGPPTYMRSVVERNVVMRRIPVLQPYFCGQLDVQREVLGMEITCKLVTPRRCNPELLRPTAFRNLSKSSTRTLNRQCHHGRRNSQAHRSPIFSDSAWRWCVDFTGVSGQRIGPIFKREAVHSWAARPLYMRRTSCPETSATTYHGRATCQKSKYLKA